MTGHFQIQNTQMYNHIYDDLASAVWQIYSTKYVNCSHHIQQRHFIYNIYTTKMETSIMCQLKETVSNVQQ